MPDKNKIEINVDDMTWDDMRVLMSLQGDNSDPLAIVDIFDRFVIGGAAAVPIMQTQEVITGIVEAIGELTNRKNLASPSTPPSGQTTKRRRNTSS